MFEKTDTCAHPSCDCPAPAGGDYCSDYCSREDDDFETGCQCGHPECQVKTVGGIAEGSQR
jgi:hypothetical protein